MMGKNVGKNIFLKGLVIILCLNIVGFVLKQMITLKSQVTYFTQPTVSNVSEVTEVIDKENSVIIHEEAVLAWESWESMTHDFCSFKPLSPANAVEERLILDSIAWPETPSLSGNHSLGQTSNPAQSTFTILPRKGGGKWHVGDQLEVMVQINDFQGHAKKSGGDVLLAQLHNRELEAGVAGQVVDHLNGSYSAVFTLLWEGSAEVQVILVHSSEAVTVLSRLTKANPDRIFFSSVFRTGRVKESSICNICLHQTTRPLCNYTDPHTGDPWFCYKPRKLSCDARINHNREKLRMQLNANERKLFQSKINLKVFIQAAGPSTVDVLPQSKDQRGANEGKWKFGPSGYYYQGLWRFLENNDVHQFNNLSASQCLQGKRLHLYGDSTIRQWFEYLNILFPDMTVRQEYLNQSGPFLLWDKAKNILVTYRCHGPPLRFRNVPLSGLRYIGNELDGLAGGTDTVVVIGIWSHFSTFPLELYIRRLQGIRRAVVRLLNRAPGTLVVIRTANPKGLTLYETITNSDWYSLQQDKVLRAVFKGVNVQLVDAWEMSLAHYLPHSLHPQPPIIKNMIDVLLSYICQ